ncbi:MAG: QueT transporter family protein [Sarcina sp.]
MNKSVLVRKIVISGLIAALYATLTLALAPLSYGNIQFRISEILVLLAAINSEYIIGLTLGCFLANMLGPNGMVDVVIGTLATFLSVQAIYLTTKFIKNKHALIIASLWPTIINGIMIGIMLNIVAKMPLFLTMIEVGLGEFVVITIIGVPVFKLMSKQKIFKYNG